VAAALGLDPSELESDGESSGDIADGVIGADDGDGVLLNSPFAPLLGAVTEEITARWRSAIAGRWSPTQAKPLGPCTPHAYLERKLRPEDAERYAAAGVLPYLSEDGLDDALSALGGGLELIVGGPESLAAGAPCLPGDPAAPAVPGMRSPEGPLGNTFVLLARQGPGKRRKRYLAKLQLLGGKREGSDVGPLATALREIKEETGGLLNAASVRRELLGPVLWIPQGRFALFLYGMQAHQRQTLPSAFEGRADAPEVNGEVEALEWVPLTELLTKSRALRQGIAPFARHVIIQPQLLRHFVVQAGKARQAAQTAEAANAAAAQAAAQAEEQAETRKRAKAATEAARQAASQARQAAQAAQAARAVRAQQQAREDADERQEAQSRLVAMARRAAAHAPVREQPVAPPGVVARSVNDVAELLKLAPTANTQHHVAASPPPADPPPRR
jgi:8-oxo-dGTP pyrophosphatase MutT (NUDIX family)